MKILDHLRELWKYRELIRNLVVRDLKVRYKNSVLGIAWSYLSPLLMMIVYTTFFTIVFQRRDIHHYPVFLLCGTLPWGFFTDSVIHVANRFVLNTLTMTPSALITAGLQASDTSAVSDHLPSVVDFALGRVSEVQVK